jgi:hypothetical protein
MTAPVPEIMYCCLQTMFKKFVKYGYKHHLLIEEAACSDFFQKEVLKTFSKHGFK